MPTDPILSNLRTDEASPDTPIHTHVLTGRVFHL